MSPVYTEGESGGGHPDFVPPHSVSSTGQTSIPAYRQAGSPPVGGEEIVWDYFQGKQMTFRPGDIERIFGRKFSLATRIQLL